jgi:hypothetical protein
MNAATNAQPGGGYNDIKAEGAEILAPGFALGNHWESSDPKLCE